eukprot:7873228-Heterocapsa_arctica.AAC.1
MAWREAEASIEKGLKRASAELHEEAEAGHGLARPWEESYRGGRSDGGGDKGFGKGLAGSWRAGYRGGGRGSRG